MGVDQPAVVGAQGRGLVECQLWRQEVVHHAAGDDHRLASERFLEGLLRCAVLQPTEHTDAGAMHLPGWHEQVGSERGDRGAKRGGAAGGARHADGYERKPRHHYDGRPLQAREEQQAGSQHARSGD